MDASAWTHAAARARQLATPHTADYPVAHPMLAEHLTDGLAVHGHTCE